MSIKASAGIETTGTIDVAIIGPFREPQSKGGQTYYRCGHCDAEAADRSVLIDVSYFHNTECLFG
ncbi:hypothetical protein [Haloprofundus salilacus]|uniref:hypothetical protein n=1 Tax=Haloprofundus salilacus TaxID=2876190 RepID=UPI001CD04095|nr:hypothetical protein [Haloprofundus salilacus]